jgi:hypothetical protein
MPIIQERIRQMAQTEEAQELAERAATQASHAGKNVGRAAKAVAEVATEEVSDVSKNLVRSVRSVDARVFLVTTAVVASGTYLAGYFRGRGRRGVVGPSSPIEDRVATVVK